MRRMRERKLEARSNFHEGGTPKYDAFYTSKDYRSRLAAQMKSMRAKAKAGNVGYYDKQKMDEVARASGYANQMRRHPLRR
jgi:hypothetical protein